MKRLDAYIVARFQNFADWFEAKTGKNKFFLARVSALLIVSAIVARALYMGYAGKLWFLGQEVARIAITSVDIFVAFFFLADAFWMQSWSETVAKEGKAKKIPPLIGRLLPYLRILSILVFLFICVLGFRILILGVLQMLAFMLWMFFDQCALHKTQAAN